MPDTGVRFEYVPHLCCLLYDYNIILYCSIVVVSVEVGFNGPSVTLQPSSHPLGRPMSGHLTGCVRVASSCLSFFRFAAIFSPMLNVYSSFPVAWLTISSRKVRQRTLLKNLVCCASSSSSSSSSSSYPSAFWLVRSFPSGIVACHSFHFSITVNSCVSGDFKYLVEVFPRPSPPGYCPFKDIYYKLVMPNCVPYPWVASIF